VILFETLLVAIAVMPGPAAPAADTLLDLRRGDRIVIESLDGEVSIVAWNRDQLEVRGEASDQEVLVRRVGSRVAVMHDDQKGRRRHVEITLRVPSWVDVEVDGRSLDVRIDGVGGRIEVGNVRGDVWVQNAAGAVAVRTMSGTIDVVGATGGVSASSQSGDVTLRNVSGPLSVESGSGDIGIVNARSESVRVETLNGDIEFSGPIGTGDYGFFVHDGDAMIAIPADTNARISVSTFDGEFHSDFPVLIERFRGGREFGFTVGTGGARVQIQVFDGEIRLLRRREGG